MILLSLKAFFKCILCNNCWNASGILFSDPRSYVYPFFGDVPVADVGVVKVVGSNLARGKIEAKYLQHLSAQLIYYIPLYLSAV